MSTPPAKGNRAIVWGLLAICLTPPLLAAILLYLAPPGMLGDSSHGTLLDGTHPLADVALGDPRGRVGARLHGKWSLLYLGGPHCAAACQDELRRMRAAWFSLGSRAQRVQCIYILPSRAPPGQELTELLQNLPGQRLWRLPAPGAHISDLFQGGTLVLVDPNGVPVMRYTGDVPFAHIAKDLKRLLRASRIG